MTQLIIPTATADFADLKTRLRISVAIESAIARSFISHGMRSPTTAEVTRRFNLCFEGYRVMRNEMKWSIARCVDMFDRILVAGLDGQAVKYAHRSSWFGAA